jgi:hypothetical protein
VPAFLPELITEQLPRCNSGVRASLEMPRKDEFEAELGSAIGDLFYPSYLIGRIRNVFHN